MHLPRFRLKTRSSARFVHVPAFNSSFSCLTQEIYMSPVWQELHGEVGAEQPHEAAHGREALQVHLAHLPLLLPHGLRHEGPL